MGRSRELQLKKKLDWYKDKCIDDHYVLRLSPTCVLVCKRKEDLVVGMSFNETLG